jgi:hypothetical protein
MIKKTSSIGSVVLDRLIRQILRERVNGREPSSAVWDRIRRQAGARTVCRRRKSFADWCVAVVHAPQVDVDLFRYVTAGHSRMLWKYDPVMMRSLDYWPVLGRLGW